MGKEKLKEILLEIKKAVDEKLATLDQVDESELFNLEAHYDQVLQDVTYPDL